MPIPKVIYQTWVTKDLPETVQVVRANILKRNPGFDMILYDDDDMDTFIRTTCDPSVYQAYSQLNVGAAKADLWRYCILYEYGGIYLDMDAEILRPLDELIEPTDDCIITRENNDNGTFNNWILMFQKGHPILKEAIDLCVYNICNRTTIDISLLTGPGGPFSNAVNNVMMPYYSKLTDLYYEDDNVINVILNKIGNKVRCRFYGIDMGTFAKWKHDAVDDLYYGHVYWPYEKKIWKN